MARSLEFLFGKHRFSREIAKVDRTKLYGSIEVETLDADGNRCKLATLAGDGKTLIPNGGTAFGYVNPDGEWVDRGELVPVDARGNRMNEMPSSFSMPTEIEEELDVETFLNHSIRLCYRLEGEDPLPEDMRARLEEGAIYRIQFSYRGGVDPDDGFLLLGEKGSLWLLIASENEVEFVGLEQAALCGTSEADDTDEDEDADPLDFEML